MFYRPWSQLQCAQELLCAWNVRHEFFDAADAATAADFCQEYFQHGPVFVFNVWATNSGWLRLPWKEFCSVLIVDGDIWEGDCETSCVFQFIFTFIDTAPWTIWRKKGNKFKIWKAKIQNSDSRLWIWISHKLKHEPQYLQGFQLKNNSNIEGKHPQNISGSGGHDLPLGDPLPLISTPPPSPRSHLSS